MMLALLLARSGIPVLVLEKHADFLRDFRGDTIHPSTLQIMHELGMLDEFLRRPHQKARTFGAHIGNEFVEVGDLTHLPTHCRFIALMPQWDFLDFVSEQARRYPVFQLQMQAEVTGLIEEDGRVVGVRAETPSGPAFGARRTRYRRRWAPFDRAREGRSRGRRSRRPDGRAVDAKPRDPDDPGQILLRFDAGRILVLFNRADYWQCGFVIAKGGFDEIRRRGLPALREEIARLAPYLRARTDELRDWSDIKLLTVAVDRLRVWHRPGLLCIGDAAHAMSPIGGVGINLAIQDAVAAANILAPRFLQAGVSDDDLRAVQRRREFPTRATQRLQVLMQNRVVGRVLTSSAKLSPPLPMRLFARWPFLRRWPGAPDRSRLSPRTCESPG